MLQSHCACSAQLLPCASVRLLGSVSLFVTKVQLVSTLLTAFNSDEAFADRVTLPAHYLEEGVGCMLRARVKP